MELERSVNWNLNINNRAKVRSFRFILNHPHPSVLSAIVSERHRHTEYFLLIYKHL